jgi:hypothetical protein
MQPDDLDDPARMAWLVLTGGGTPGWLFDRRLHAGSPRSTWTFFDASNASVPREPVISVGGFDEGYPGWDLGEWGLADREFAYRLDRAGLPFRFEPRAYTLRQRFPHEPVSEADRIRHLSYFFARHTDLDRGSVEPLLRRG